MTILPHGSRTSRPRTSYRVTFVVLCVGVTSFSLLQSMVNPVLSTIQDALHTDQATVTWVLTAYLLSASVFTPIVGRVGDKVGKERMLVVTLAALAVGSVVAALAPNIGVLIAARVIQGAGGGVLPLTFGIIRDEFPRDKVAGAVGTSASLLAVGGGFGLVISGPLVRLLSYHWLFWLPGIAITIAAVAAARYVPESPERTPGPISFGSAVLFSGWLVALLLAVSQGHSWGWWSVPSVALFTTAAVMFPAWVRAETVSSTPLIDMTMMRIPTVWTVNVVTLLFGIGMYSTFAFLPQLLQTPADTGYGLDITVSVTGLLLLPQTVTTFLAGTVCGRLTAVYGAKPLLVIGAGLTSLATFSITAFHSAAWQVVAATTVLGFAFGLAFAAISNLIVDAVPQSQTGVANGMNANIRTVGGALGGAVLGSVVTAGHRTDGYPIESGYIHGFGLLALASGLAALVALLVPVVRAPTHLVAGPQADAEAELAPDPV